MNNLHIFKTWSVKIQLFFCLIEILFFHNLSVFIGIIYSLYGWFLVCRFVLIPINLYNFTLSSFVIIGYGVCSFYLPIPATLISLRPVTYNMNVPIEVFIHGILSISVVILSFFFYKKLRRGQYSRDNSVMKKLKLYQPLSDNQIWVLGFIGTLAIIYSYYSGKNTVENISVGNKFIDGFTVFAYAPIYLFFKGFYSYTKTGYTKSKAIYIIYFAFLMVAALMSNHRSTFMTAFMGIGFTYLIGVLIGNLSFNIFTPKKIVLLTILFVLLTGPLTKIGIAMVIVRAEKHNTSAIDLAQGTVQTIFDKNKINAGEKIISGNMNVDSYWDEHYTGNLFLDRLCNLKFADLSLYYSKKLQNNNRIREYLYESVLCLLPSTILNFLNYNIDKKTLTTSSYGDHLYSYATGDYYGIGGERQSQLYGAGMSAFGYLYLVILFLILLPLFYSFDIWTFHRNGKVYLSLLALVNLPFIFQIFNLEGISSFVNFLCRSWIQDVFIYFLLCFVIRKLIRG